MSEPRTTLCIAENRRDCEPGLRLLLASLTRHWPEQSVHVFYPDPTPAFRAWLADKPAIRLNALDGFGPWEGYNIKPALLAALLDAGHDAVTWIDSDIILTASPATLLARDTLDEVIVCEEAMIETHGSFDQVRTRLWGLPVGRALPFALNSCVLGVTREHRALIDTWRELLRSDAYRQAQRLPHGDRPIHMMGDQEVLTALLASERFAAVPLRILRRGHDLIQYLGTVGYTVRERLRHLAGGLPPLVHSQGYKPWWPSTAPVSGYDRLLNIYKMLSPYRLIAQGYETDLVDAGWLEAPTLATRLLSALSFGRPALIGLPIAAAIDLQRVARRADRRREVLPARFGNGMPVGNRGDEHMAPRS